MYATPRDGVDSPAGNGERGREQEEWQGRDSVPESSEEADRLGPLAISHGRDARTRRRTVCAPSAEAGLIRKPGLTLLGPKT